jgi:MYXO-CTERM domain-containing protein
MHKLLLVRLGSLALGLGLSAMILAPRTAHAIIVQCADEYGDCEVSNTDFDYISCTCSNDSAFGGTGGMDWVGMTEDELMQVCLEQLASCSWGDTFDGGSDTGWNDDWGESGWVDTGEWGDTGWNDDLGDTFGDGWDWGDTFGDGWETGEWGDTFAETGMVTDGGESGVDDGGSSDDGSSSDTGTDDWDTFGDSSTGGSDESGESGDGTETGHGSESESGTGGDSGPGDDELGESDTGGDGGIDGDEGCNCSAANDAGAGAVALFGLLGLLGLRRRER